MLTRELFLPLFAANLKKTCYVECRRYGVIRECRDYEIERGSQEGSHRIVTIEHYGMRITFHLHNGDVIRMIKKQ